MVIYHYCGRESMEDFTMGRSDRSQYYAFIVYPDSVPEGWMDILNAEHVNLMISPLHQPDSEKAKGEHGAERKEHYHVMVLYDSLKSKEQALEIATKVNGSGVIRIASMRGYARYLTHLDDKNKQQWPADVQPIIFGDINYWEIISSPADTQVVLGEIIQFIRRNGILSFAVLSDYALQYNQSWFDVLSCKRTLFLKEYLKSREWMKKTGDENLSPRKEDDYMDWIRKMEKERLETIHEGIEQEKEQR